MKKSNIIIGCMSWGNGGKQMDTASQTDLIQFCVDNRLTTFDHADIYGDYTTEAQFGKAFEQSGIDRSKIQLISKCGIQYPGQTRNNSVKHYNYSKDYIIWSAEQSLKNLKTDYLDLFLLHRPSPLMHPEDIAAAIYKLKGSGKIKRFGVSNFMPSQMHLLQQKTNIEANQIEISLTHPSAMTNGDLDYLFAHKIQPMCWSPLGTYFNQSNEQNQRIQDVLSRLTDKYNAEEDTILLAWILKHPSNISPVIGTTNKERILRAKAALSIDLELEDWFLLLEASNGQRVP